MNLCENNDYENSRPESIVRSTGRSKLREQRAEASCENRRSESIVKKAYRTRLWKERTKESCENTRPESILRTADRSRSWEQRAEASWENSRPESIVRIAVRSHCENSRVYLCTKELQKPTRSPQKPKQQDIRQEAKENNLKADIVAASSDAKQVVRTADRIRLWEQPIGSIYKNDEDFKIVSIDYMENPKANKQLNKEDTTKNDKRENHHSTTKIKKFIKEKYQNL